MRTKTFTAATAVVAALLLTACAPSPEHRSGDAAPAGAPTLSASPTTSPAASPTTQAPSSTPAATKTSATTTTLVLGPQGYGALRLGMTREQALATGVVAPFETGTGCTTTEVRGAPKGGWVMFSPTLGLTAIDAWSTLRTKEGVHIGMSGDEMRRIYPNWTIVDGANGNGRGYVKVPGNDKASYRITVYNDKVDELTLQLGNQNCYE
ncbi:hypothetical protein GCM10009827_083640 [Dactylosporangium maewongense]|uniref:Lipoprotein n=1 Tax=Dactylosporangium maewongense TaxID=634393 RepID=A0ABN2C022_9ACTN